MSNHASINFEKWNSESHFEDFLGCQKDINWDNKQQSQAQSDRYKMQMALGSARWRWEFWGTAWSNESDANPPKGDNPWNLLFRSSMSRKLGIWVWFYKEAFFQNIYRAKSVTKEIICSVQISFFINSKSKYRIVASTNTCYYSENQVLGGCYNSSFM